MEIADIKQHLTLSMVSSTTISNPTKTSALPLFHDDKTRSLQVYYKTYTVYCFSSNCKTHGKGMDIRTVAAFPN